MEAFIEFFLIHENYKGKNEKNMSIVNMNYIRHGFGLNL